MHSDQKMILAGSTLHYYQYSKPVFYDFKRPETYKKARGAETEIEPIAGIDNTAAKFSANSYRAKKNVKLLLQSNAWEYMAEGSTLRPVFITFTFKENVKQLQQANYDYKKFTQRFNYQIFGTKQSRLKYLTVPEFQKRGAVHYHTIYFNLPNDIQKIYEDSAYTNEALDFVRSVWGEGFTFVKSVDSIDHLTNYIAKYFTKNRNDLRFFDQKKYFTSREIHRPREYRDKTIIQELIKACDTPNFTQEFKSKDNQTLYQCFDLPEQLKQYSLQGVYSVLALE